MSRRCMLTGTRVMVGNNVSHANNRTKRRFLPNLCTVTLVSDLLQQSYKMRITASALRTINKIGLDELVLKSRDSDLSEKAQKIKRDLQKRIKEGVLEENA